MSGPGEREAEAPRDRGAAEPDDHEADLAADAALLGGWCPDFHLEG